MSQKQNKSTSCAKKLKILVAEDYPIMQKFITAILQKDGHTVKVAENGNQVLQYLQQESYNFILMDIQMPEMDGIQATKTIRDPNSHFYNSKIPIIAMTADNPEDTNIDFERLGMNGYIIKPIKAKDLLEMVQKYL